MYFYWAADQSAPSSSVCSVESRPSPSRASPFPCMVKKLQNPSVAHDTVYQAGLAGIFYFPNIFSPRSELASIFMFRGLNPSGGLNPVHLQLINSVTPSSWRCRSATCTNFIAQADRPSKRSFTAGPEHSKMAESTACMKMAGCQYRWTTVMPRCPPISGPMYLLFLQPPEMYLSPSIIILRWAPLSPSFTRVKHFMLCSLFVHRGVKAAL